LITTKSVSQVTEQMFHTRLRVVQDASAHLHEAKSKVTEAEQRVASANDPVKSGDDAIARIDTQISDVTKSLAAFGPPPKPTVIVIGHDKKGRKITKVVTPVWAGKSSQDTRDNLIAQRDKLLANAAPGKAEVQTAALALTEARSNLTSAEDVHKRAVMDSQLHSFTSMVFGVDPIDVTDAQVAWFLRFFILIPSLMVAISATVLAAASVHRIKTKDPQTPLVSFTRSIRNFIKSEMAANQKA
jgi:hypothetical protein